MAIERPAAPGARAVWPHEDVRYVGWQCRLYPNRLQARLLALCREGLRELSNELLLGASNLRYSKTGRHMTAKEFGAAAGAGVSNPPGPKAFWRPIPPVRRRGSPRRGARSCRTRG